MVVITGRAIYINKLEIINDTIDAFNKSMIIQYNAVQCNSKKFSSYCISKYAKELIFQTNIGNFILLKSIMMDEKEFIVLVKFNSISIYSFINIGNNFVHLKGLYTYLLYQNVYLIKIILTLIRLNHFLNIHNLILFSNYL